METRDELIHILPSQIQKLFAPNTPGVQRMMAARGLLPTTPENLILALLLLQTDSDPNIQAAAAQTLQKTPENIMVTAINHKQTPEAMLVALGPLGTVSQTIASALILNSKTPDAILVQLATKVPENICELIANNQARIMKCPQIAVALAANPQALRSSVDRVFDFLARSGVVVENSAEYEAAMERLNPTERAAAAENVALPKELSALLQPDQPEAAAAAPAQPVHFVPKPKEEETNPEEEQKRLPMMKLISTLNTAQKVALATKGNKEARAILIKDANKMVCTSVIKSPSISDQEIAAAAASRSVNEEVIRIICKTPSMLRPYSVKVALVNNPRTPLHVALTLLPQLRKTDIKLISKSKEVSTALVNLAKKLSAG